MEEHKRIKGEFTWIPMDKRVENLVSPCLTENLN